MGTTVWQSVPTASKVDARWEGRWTVAAIELPDSRWNKEKVVHVNMLRHHFQPEGILEAGTSNSNSYKTIP